MKIVVKADTSYSFGGDKKIWVQGPPTMIREERTYYGEPIIVVSRGKNHYNAYADNPAKVRKDNTPKEIMRAQNEPSWQYFYAQEEFDEKGFDIAYNELKRKIKENDF